MYMKYDKSTLYLPSVRSNFSKLLNVTSIIKDLSENTFAALDDKLWLCYV